MGFFVIIHHMGKFVRAKKLRYMVRRNIGYIMLIQILWSYFKVLAIVREFKHVRDFKLWWKPNKGSMDNNLKLLILKGCHGVSQLCRAKKR